MKYAINKSQLAQMIKQRNGYLVLASGLIILCILLSLLVFKLVGRQRVVIVPPVVEKSFWVSENKASTAYLAEMTTFFAFLRFNVTPSNAERLREVLLHYTDPRYYGALKNELVEEGDYIKQEHITTAFFPVDIKVSSKHLNAIITGDLQTTIGKEVMPSKRVAYKISYSYNHGRLLVKAFKEIKPDA